MKRFLFCLALIVLVLGLSALAHASQDASVSSRISFYYQYEGGARSTEGFWDRMLKDRLLALYGHDTIYPYSDKFLTGRGCCLFSFSHAYQYLCGYAGTAQAKADILYNYLSVKPVWSNTGSSMSPPNAASYYASYLKNTPGVSLYTGSLDTYAKLQSFLNTGKSVVIVNVPGHYVIAVGCTKYNGVEYVHIVDSLLSATIKTGRLSRGMSMDFSVTFTPANSASYQAAVHEYWVPYSQIASSCKLKYAFRTGGTPAPFVLSTQKNELLLKAGQQADIVFTNTDELMAYTSLDEDVCTVDESGRVTAVSPGLTDVVCVSLADSRHSLVIPVYCVDAEEEQLCLLYPGESAPDPAVEGPLPDGAAIVSPDEEQISSAVRVEIKQLLDAFGDTVCEIRVTVIALDREHVIVLGSGIAEIGEEAFADGAYQAVAVPASVQNIGPLAFAAPDLQVVFVQSESTAFSSDAFGESAPLIIRDYGAFLSWYQRHE